MSYAHVTTHYEECDKAGSEIPVHTVSRVNKTQKGAINRAKTDAYRAAEKYAYPNIVVVKGKKFSDSLAIIQVFNEASNDILEEFMINRIDLGE